MAAPNRTVDCKPCAGTGRVDTVDRLADRDDNTRECPACDGSGRTGPRNPFTVIAGGPSGAAILDELARAVDSGREYALEVWFAVAVKLPHTHGLREAFRPFVVDGRVDRDRLALLQEFAREWLKVGEDCARIDARRIARAS